MQSNDDEKNKGGRPQAQIDYPILQGLCSIQCTGEECASILQIDYDTLNAALERDGEVGFSDYYKRHSCSGKASLRRLQWGSAKEGNVTMQIFLGKQWLGQHDKTGIDHTSSDKSMSPRLLSDEDLQAELERFGIRPTESDDGNG